jgi:glycosyltransferase involved in cell wall biosynthesis
VLRDIFPDWAKHLGFLGPGMKYWFFDAVARFQYRQANRIGVQSPNNLQYFQKHYSHFAARAEVLWNWVSPIENTKSTTKNTTKPAPCSIMVDETPLKGRTVMVYAGNLGVAQGGSSHLLELANLLHDNLDLGILVVGRGSEIAQLRQQIAIGQLDNIVVYDEIAVDEMPSLLAQCHMGLVLLDQRHQTHNIPGKFLSYLQAGLPIMAIVNSGNDLQLIIEKYQVGRVTTVRSQKNLQLLAESLLDEISLQDCKISARCKNLAAELFSSELAVKQIVKVLYSVK